ncbi:amino acid/polyamine transporter I [Phaeosphaeria sp. MPI-PUGE-AT-0046c]|nr:amino acid/polyamine transporter I [Phaeosphaeria sp. MPI-PUGE-AT-0046c]
MDEKTTSQRPAVLIDNVSDPDTLSLSSEDQQVMAQMGKRQQLKRRFNFFTLLGLSITLVCSWEAFGSALGISMIAGGPSSVVYGLMFTFAGTLALSASVAEMASICPISGAQMHWTYMFAPKEWRIVATSTSLCFLLAGQLQGLIKLNNPEYILERWHTTLIMWAIILVSYVQHIWTIRFLPKLQLFTGVLHFLTFFVLVVVMLVMGRNSTADFVFTGFVNQTGWKSDGVSWFVGLLPAIWTFNGFDGAIHLSEETEHSAHAIPKVIMYSILVNGPMTWIFGVLCLFSISDFSAVLATPTGYPLVEILQQATRGRAGATVIYSLILTITFGAMFADIASVSRLTWAFARDNGLPFSTYFKRIETNERIPVRAVKLLCAVMVLLSLINIGSTVALNAILSLATMSLYISYIIPIFCLISMRLRVKDKVYNSTAGYAEVSEDRLVFGPWNLGKWGMLINVCAVTYATLLLPFMSLPTSLPLTYSTMNYAGPIVLLVLSFASVDYLVRGRKFYVGPQRET